MSFPVSSPAFDKFEFVVDFRHLVDKFSPATYKFATLVAPASGSAPA